MSKDINLEILESLNYGVNYLKLPKVDGRVTINFDTSRQKYVNSTKTFWLRWKDQFYISIPCVGIAEQIKDLYGSRVSDRKSDLFKALNPDTQIQIVARFEETKETNETLSRTILTSGTTLFVSITMFFLGGLAIRDFFMAFSVGVIVGTYSSIFVAAPVTLFFDKYRNAKKTSTNAVNA